jgi:2'-5' RNA ligase
MPSSVDLHFPQLTEAIGEWWNGIHPAGVPPHITLLYPWIDDVSDRDLDVVADIASSTPAFTVTFTEARTFAGGVVYLHPEPQDTLRALMHRLAEAFPDSPIYDGAFRDPQPHLTVAKTDSPEEADAVREQISRTLALPLSSTVTALAVMTQRSGAAWATISQPALRVR